MKRILIKVKDIILEFKSKYNAKQNKLKVLQIFGNAQKGFLRLNHG